MILFEFRKQQIKSVVMQNYEHEYRRDVEAEISYLAFSNHLN